CARYCGGIYCYVTGLDSW
nr:immunoglobulin heavy chain junction region [Macaca mulatta]MOW23875.1 immunoglobulin heavy chain junction region [Macaca mulatta]MOW24435.1 immunoglobulin heavy chain junction region [Macaca mulatta]MOW26035.1 immunoglobulin heavy chain junction region [Macaca mulatta]MOW27210.1 immunoglobulin heavy chain junction region [Macaca mulatta]